MTDLFPKPNSPWAFALDEEVLCGEVKGKVRTRFRDDDGCNMYVVMHKCTQLYCVKSEASLSRLIEHVELGHTPKCKGFFPPAGGFLKNHWYIANVAYSMGNPVHEVLLYAGLCDNGDLKPGNYSHLAGLHYRMDDETSSINRPVYLRVVRDIGILGSERN